MEAKFTDRNGAIFNPIQGCDDSIFNHRGLRPRLPCCLTLSGSLTNKQSFLAFPNGFLDDLLLTTPHKSAIDRDPDTHSFQTVLHINSSKDMLSQHGCLCLLFVSIYSAPTKETLKGLKTSKPMRSIGITKDLILNPERVEQKLPIAA